MCMCRELESLKVDTRKPKIPYGRHGASAIGVLYLEKKAEGYTYGRKIVYAGGN